MSTHSAPKVYRGTEVSRAASSAVPDPADLVITDEGGYYVGDGTTQAKALLPFARRSDTLPVMHLFVTELQSNALGTNTAGAGDLTKYDTANIDVANSRLFKYEGSGSNANKIVAFAEPLRGPVNAQGMGPMGPMARHYLPTIAPSDAVLLIQAAVGSTGYAADSQPTTHYRWQVADVASTVNLHTNMKTMIVGAMAAARQMGYRPKLVGVLSQGGEADGDGGTTGTAFAGFMDAALADLRATFGNDVLYLVGRMMPGRRDSTTTGPDIDTACINAPARNELCAVVPSLDPNHNAAGDNTHADAWGQRINGYNYFQAIARARANVKGQLPQPPSNVVRTTVGSVTTITWTAPVGRVTGYLVEYVDYTTGSWTTLSTTGIGTASSITATNAPTQARVSTINEAGTSTAVLDSASGGTGIGVLPAPVGVAIVSPSTTSLTGVCGPVTGATGYSWQYRKSTDSGWTNLPVNANPVLALTGLTAGATYLVRVAVGNASAVSPYSAVVTVKTANAQSSTTFYNRYSLRKIIAAYSGPAIQVRDSAGTLTNIGFVGNDLDLNTLVTTAAGGGLTIQKFYDQSGNSRDMAQTADATAQPAVVIGGVVQTLNGRPAPLYDGSNDILLGAFAGMYAAGTASMICVEKISGVTGSNRRTFYAESRSSSDNTIYSIEEYSNSFGQFMRSDASTVMAATVAAESPAIADVASVLTFNDTGTTLSKTVNGAALANVSYTRSTSTFDQSGMGALRKKTTGPVNVITGLLPSFGGVASNVDLSADVTAERDYYGT